MSELDRFANASPKWINSAGETVIGVNLSGHRKVSVENLNLTGSITVTPVTSSGSTLGSEANPFITQFLDEYGWGVENTPLDELRVVTPYRLVGSIFEGTTLDPNFWTASLGTAGTAGGTAVVGNAQVILSTGYSANNTTSLQSVRIARYIGASSNGFRTVMRLPDAGTVNNTRRWGAFNSQNGAFFELSGTTFKVVTRKTGLDTPVANGSFNGDNASIVPSLTAVFTAEIYWTNSKVYFTFRGELIHTMAADTTTWSDTLNLPIRYENNNSGDLNSNVSMNIRVGTIVRLGNAVTQPTSFFGKSAGVTVLKYGAGSLHGLSVGNVTNGAIISLVDDITSAGRTLFSTGPMGGITQPFSLVLNGGIPFFTGLTLVISAAASYSTTIYE